MFSRVTALQADVLFQANTGQFRADMGVIREDYARTTGAMSTDSLKAAVAQEKLERTIARTGATSFATRKATLTYRAEMNALADTSLRSAAAGRENEASLLGEERALGRFSRGALAAAGVSSEIKRALLLGSGSFLLGAGVLGGLKASIDAARTEQVAMVQLQVAIQDTGHSWGVYKNQVEDALSAQVKTSAFSKEELAAALASNVRRFGDINQALRANAIDADVARGKGISLADAQTLVQRASLGQSRSLLSLGIAYVKSTANVDALKASTQHYTKEQLANAKAADAQGNELAALDAVQARFHGNAAKFLATDAGKQALFNAELKQSEDIIGEGVLPTFNRLLVKGSNYLDQLNRTGRLQHDVNVAVHDGGAAFHALENGVHLVLGVLNPVDKLLGGFENTVKTLTTALIAFKLRGALAFVTGTREIGSASVVAAGEVNGLAAAEGRAAAGAAGLAGLGAAGAAGVVGRIGWYTGAGAAAGTGGAGVAGGAAATGFLGTLAVLTFSSVGDAGHRENLGGPYHVAIDVFPGGQEGGLSYADPSTGKRIYLGIVKKGENVGKLVIADLKKRGLIGVKPSPPLTPGSVGLPFPYSKTPTATPKVRSPTTPPKSGGLIIGLTEAQQTQLYRAEGTPSTADDRAALEGQLAIYQRLLGQKGLTPADLNQLLQGRNSVIDQIAAIDQQRINVGKKASNAAAAARKKELTKLTQVPVDLRIAEATARARKDSETKIVAILREEKKALEEQVVELKKIGAAKDYIATAREREATVQAKIDAALKKKKKTASLSAGDVREFLDSFVALNQFAPNYQGAGKPTVTINQHFHDPTVDRHREAHLANLQMRAVGYG